MATLRWPPRRNKTVVNRRPSVVGRRSSLENDELRLELDDNGEIAALYDLRHGREIVVPGSTINQLVAYEDRPMNWEAWDIDIFYEEKPYPLREVVDWRVVEEGPLRSAIEIVRRLGQSTVTQRIRLGRGSRRVDFVTEVEWQERQTLLRALFPLNINATRATCEIQFGAVGAADPPQHQLGLGALRGLRAQVGRPERGRIRRGAAERRQVWPQPAPQRAGPLAAQGRYPPRPRRRSRAAPLHLQPAAARGDWRAGQVVRRAYELNAPLIVTSTDVQPNAPATDARSSFLSTPTEHIVVETLKAAQDGDGLIVRLYEAHNQRGQASLVFDRPVASAVETDLLEREVGPVAVEGRELRFEVGAVRDQDAARCGWAADKVTG